MVHFNRPQLLVAACLAYLLLALACDTVQGGGGSQPAISVDVNTPSGTTTITQGYATSLLSGAALYFGSVPSSDVDSVCNMIVNGQRSFPASVTAFGNTQDYTFDLDATGGCGTSQSQSVFDVSGGNAPPNTKVAVVCGNDPNAAPGTCDTFVNNPDIQDQYDSQVNQGGKRRRLRQTNCDTCLENCVCTNVNNNCFPGSAQVEVQGRGKVSIADIKVGDHVQTIDSKGISTFEPVYLFGHRDAATTLPVAELAVKSPAANATLSLSPQHFMMAASSSGSDAVHTYAKNVQIGNRVTMIVGGQPTAAIVTGKRMSLKSGAFNPFTKGGNIVVDGVLASCHSDWFLDDFLQRHAPAHTHLLPALYQVLLKPFHLAYLVIGGRLGDRINNYFLDGSQMDLRRTAGAMSGAAASVAILGSTVAMMAKGRRSSA